MRLYKQRTDIRVGYVSTPFLKNKPLIYVCVIVLIFTCNEDPLHLPIDKT